MAHAPCSGLGVLLGPMAELSRLAVVAAFLACLTGCSSEIEGEARGTGGGSVTAQTEATARERVATGDIAPTPGVPEELDYVALGDSLAVGVGSERGYVERYAGHLRDDTGSSLRVANFGVSGQTAPELLGVLRNDPEIRAALRRAEVVTFNTGINDLGEAGRSYENGTCGGPDGQECLREAVGSIERDWDSVTAEIVRLRSPDDAIIRTTGLGYTPNVGGVFKPYLAEVNRHIAASADRNGIPRVQVRLGGEGLSADGVHPNGEGYEEISAALRTLGYEPSGLG